MSTAICCRKHRLKPRLDLLRPHHARGFKSRGRGRAGPMPESGFQQELFLHSHTAHYQGGQPGSGQGRARLYPGNSNENVLQCGLVAGEINPPATRAEVRSTSTNASRRRTQRASCTAGYNSGAVDSRRQESNVSSARCDPARETGPLPKENVQRVTFGISCHCACCYEPGVVFFSRRIERSRTSQRPLIRLSRPGLFWVGMNDCALSELHTRARRICPAARRSRYILACTSIPSGLSPRDAGEIGRRCVWRRRRALTPTPTHRRGQHRCRPLPLQLQGLWLCVFSSCSKPKW